MVRIAIERGAAIRAACRPSGGRLRQRPLLREASRLFVCGDEHSYGTPALSHGNTFAATDALEILAQTRLEFPNSNYMGPTSMEVTWYSFVTTIGNASRPEAVPSKIE
jgi:hypothetical protein